MFWAKGTQLAGSILSMKTSFPGNTKQVSFNAEGLRRGLAGEGNIMQSSASMKGSSDSSD